MTSSNIQVVTDNESTNAAAESFNTKVKDFRRQFRGVVDVNEDQISLWHIGQMAQ